MDEYGHVSRSLTPDDLPFLSWDVGDGHDLGAHHLEFEFTPDGTVEVFYRNRITGYAQEATLMMHAIEVAGDCPTVTSSGPSYHLDEGSLGYAQERMREEHDRHIKGDAVGVMRQVGIDTDTAKGLADKMKAFADGLRQDVDGMTDKRRRAVGDAGGRLFERVVGE